MDQVFYRPSRSFYNGGAKVGPLSLASYDASKYTLEDSSYSVAESVKQRVGADFVAPEILKDLEDICTRGHAVALGSRRDDGRRRAVAARTSALMEVYILMYLPSIGRSDDVAVAARMALLREPRDFCSGGC